MTYYQPDMVIASLDHAMWFYQDFRVDDWLLYACDSPVAGHARGLNHGNIFSRDGHAGRLDPPLVKKLNQSLGVD